MSRVLILCCVLVLLLQVSAVDAAGAGLRLSYGKAPGQVSFDNPSVNKLFEESSALGPLAFRRHGDAFWVADSLAGRVLCIGDDGKLRHSLAVPGVPENTLLEDLALVPGPDGKIRSLWVGDGADLYVRQIEVPSGKELVRFGGRGEKPGQFLQIHQIEVGPTGRVYVGDYGRGVVAVFSPAGKLLREIPWQLSGLAVDEQDQLFVITYTENSGFFLQQHDAEGRMVRSVHLGQSGAVNPRIWGLSATGGVWVTFTPPAGFKGYLHLLHFNRFGGIAEKLVVQPVPGMNRFLDLTSGRHFWQAVANYGAAPGGAFVVQAMPREGAR